MNDATLRAIKAHLRPAFETYGDGPIRIHAANRTLMLSSCSNDVRFDRGWSQPFCDVPLALAPYLPPARAWLVDPTTPLPGPPRWRSLSQGGYVGPMIERWSVYANRRETRIEFLRGSDTLAVHPRLERVLLIAHAYLLREEEQ